MPGEVFPIAHALATLAALVACTCYKGFRRDPCFSQQHDTSHLLTRARSPARMTLTLQTVVVTTPPRLRYPSGTHGGLAMLSREENALLTQVGPATPLGHTMRRYWIPALLAWELPEPDCPPVHVKLLVLCLDHLRPS